MRGDQWLWWKLGATHWLKMAEQILLQCAENLREEQASLKCKFSDFSRFLNFGYKFSGLKLLLMLKQKCSFLWWIMLLKMLPLAFLITCVIFSVGITLIIDLELVSYHHLFSSGNVTTNMDFQVLLVLEALFRFW